MGQFLSHQLCPDDLPDAIWALVFACLGDQDKLAVLQTCKDWHRIAREDGAFWRRLRLDAARLRQLSAADPRAAAGWAWQRGLVQELQLAGVEYGPSVAGLLALPALRSLHLKVIFGNKKQAQSFFLEVRAICYAWEQAKEPSLLKRLAQPGPPGAGHGCPRRTCRAAVG